MFKIWLSNNNKIVVPLLYSDIRMEGELNRSTLICNDGHKYYKVISNKKKTKIYFKCYKYRRGCRVMLHTKYTDKDKEQLQIIYSNGNHNHPVYKSCIAADISRSCDK